MIIDENDAKKATHAGSAILRVFRDEGHV